MHGPCPAFLLLLPSSPAVPPALFTEGKCEAAYIDAPPAKMAHVVRMQVINREF